MYRLKLLIPLIFTALVVASCSTSPTGRSQMIWKSDAELEAQSARAFNQMRAGMPLSTDRKKIDFVACVAEAVVAVLDPPLSDIEWELAVFDSESVNAFAMPGGKIGVFTGILEVTENQHQLGAVIGHEIAHVTARHSNERASRASISGGLINVAAIVLGGGHSGATYTAQQALNAGADFGISLPHTRGQESEADIIGLEYMAKAGFDPRESVKLWQRMDATTDKKPAEFMSTHPASETRIEALVSEWPKTLPLYNQAVEEGRVPTCSK
ncbi:MAG: M48 family metallopeptidase [Gammaproteobacteria bacterium]|nr:M48 family metallopeptidase [Gammaproteobacteria bacterium]MBU2676840.1 M48 family metallopeptidase [Gammaproteobacteria bacterium]NNC58252.1 M48 family metallopeptidase [Woeseiaceae bacterium]NNL50574.1 M48 family metallopeptidase [Woeseiaceae bacterium]